MPGRAKTYGSLAIVQGKGRHAEYLGCRRRTVKAWRSLSRTNRRQQPLNHAQFASAGINATVFCCFSRERGPFLICSSVRGAKHRVTHLVVAPPRNPL